MSNYYQPEIETMPREQIKALQSERLVKQVRRVYDSVPYYRAKMDAKGVTPDDIHGVEDLHKLPFLSKADLREAYPYGLLGAPISDCVRIHSGYDGQACCCVLHTERCGSVGRMLRTCDCCGRRHK